MIGDLNKNKSCVRCNKSANKFGGQIELTEYNDKLYCDDCLKIVELETKVIGVPLSVATDSDKLSGIIKLLDSIETESVEQTNHLKTIKTILVIFSVLFVIGVLIQSCSR